MKKRICMVLSTLIIFSAIATTTHAQEKTSPKVKPIPKVRTITTYSAIDPDTEH